jgi:hypothetical protein
LANGVEVVQDGRIYIEHVNAPFLAAGGSGEDFRSGVERAIAQGWLWRHESGTCEIHRGRCCAICLIQGEVRRLACDLPPISWEYAPTLVSKHRNRRYQGGRSKYWVKIKNRKHPTMSRVMEAFA